MKHQIALKLTRTEEHFIQRGALCRPDTLMFLEQNHNDNIVVGRDDLLLLRRLLRDIENYLKQTQLNWSATSD